MDNIELTDVDRMILRSYQLMLEGLAEYIGIGYEIILHSLENVEHSAVKVINGHFTGRAEGAPITDLAVRMLSEIKDSGDGLRGLIYFNKNRSGVTTKSATIPIVGENDRIIGLLCINFYMDIPLSAFLDSFTKVRNPEVNATENFVSSSEERIREAVETAKMQTMNNSNIPATQKNKEIISILYGQSIFQIKNAAEIVSALLGISRNTVYLHLRNLANTD